MRYIVFGTVTLALAACSGSGSDPDISTAEFLDEFPAETAVYRSGGTSFRGTEGSVEIQAGLTPDGVEAIAVVDITGDLGGALTGNAAYDGSYSIEGFRNVVASDADPDRPFDGNIVRESGTFTIFADLDTARLTATDDFVSIEADIAGSEVNGSVVVDGVSGSLIGGIGQSTVLAGIIAESDDAAYAGIVRGTAAAGP